MSNFTDFFPIPAAGSSEITNPDKLPIVAPTATSETYTGGMFYTKSANSYTSTYNAASTNNSLTGTNFGSNNYSAQATLTAGTENTLLNITSGSGYLCNVYVPSSDIGATNRVQRIIIIVDGTTYTYQYDFSTYTTYYTALLWGFSSHGDFASYNTPNDYQATGIYGHGGNFVRYATDEPALSFAPSDTNSMLRVYSAYDFFKLNLPKLRFESSLQVKVLTQSLYTTSGVEATAAALYYLDTQIANM
jgi:hypothetical protein